MRAAWKQGESNVTFEDRDPKIFQIFADWLIKKTIVFKAFGTLGEDIRRGVQTQSFEKEILVDAYLLGDFLEAPLFKTAVINELCSSFADRPRVPHKELVNLAYGNTEPGSPLRNLLADVFAFDAVLELAHVGYEVMDPTFWKDVAFAMIKIRGSPKNKNKTVRVLMD